MSDDRTAAKKTRPKKPTGVRFNPWFLFKKYTPKILRLSAFLAAVYVVALLIIGHRARAQVSETLMGLGVEMLRYEDAERMGAPRTFHLNGQPIELASGLTRHSLDEVLDYYEEKCMERDGRFAEQIQEILDGNPDIEGVDPTLLDPTLREQEDGKGFVACFETGTGRLEPSDVAERWRRFEQSLDLSEFGEMRYIYAEESDDATMFIAFWVEGSFRVMDMFPPEGDAPGEDIAGVPRPPEGRRILSAWEEGHPQKVAMYTQLDGTAPQSIEDFYRQQMPEEGWTLLEAPDRLREHVDPDRIPEHFLVYERGEDMVALMMVENERTGQLTTTVLRSR